MIDRVLAARLVISERRRCFTHDPYSESLGNSGQGADRLLRRAPTRDPCHRWLMNRECRSTVARLQITVFSGGRASASRWESDMLCRLLGPAAVCALAALGAPAARGADFELVDGDRV